MSDNQEKTVVKEEVVKEVVKSDPPKVTVDQFFLSIGKKVGKSQAFVLDKLYGNRQQTFGEWAHEIKEDLRNELFPLTKVQREKLKAEKKAKVEDKK